MVLVDNETLAAVHLAFRTGGKAAAVTELRRRFWLLDTAAGDAADRVLAWPPEGSAWHRPSLATEPSLAA